jgi:hypothetical protein
MDKTKCSRCGLVNLATDETCRRCGADLSLKNLEASEQDDAAPRRRGFKQRLIWVVATTSVLLFGFYMSLLLTSDDLGFEQREVVSRAAAVLELKGFRKEAFVVKHLAAYRSTDNWFNNYIGHRDAYAATNFPFEVLTLYPEFFKVSVDDDERAAMLLHEAYHLMGYGEEAALEAVWRNKQQLGWTDAKYAESKVWKNTRDLTMGQVPRLFRCGNDGKSDCFQ